MSLDTLRRFREFYDQFSPQWVERIDELYAPGVEFRDAFHQIRADIPAMKRYFHSIFEKLAESRFVVHDAVLGDDGAYVRWVWHWRWREKDDLREVEGVTHLRFDEQGRIRRHRDFFDSAEVYDAFPVLGGLLRTVRSRI